MPPSADQPADQPAERATDHADHPTADLPVQPPQADAPPCWALLQPWWPAGVAWCWQAIGQHPGLIGALAPQEAAAVAQAAPKRQREFAAGRWCAHKALAALGREATAVPVGPQRAPVWPAGLVGTISHDDAWAVAGVAPGQHWAGLGVDIERCDQVPAALAGELCTPLEQARLAATAGEPARQQQLACLFSAKEAAFKALHPGTGAWIGFDEAELVSLPTGRAGPFELRLLRDIGPHARHSVLTGAVAVADGRVVALMALPAHTGASGHGGRPGLSDLEH